MIEWKAVPLDEIRVGDEVRVDGFGVDDVSAKAVESLAAMGWEVLTVESSYVKVRGKFARASFRRSSIVEARRKVDEPVQKIGNWRHRLKRESDGWHSVQLPSISEAVERQVIRSISWSPDERKGRDRRVR